MPVLREEQRRMQRAILAHAAPPGPAATAGIGRISVYRHAYRARLAGALQSNYPRLAQWLGPEGFRSLALRYALAHPPRHFSIRWHGDELGAFIGRGPLADMARMEWALGEAFDAPDSKPLGVEELAAIGADACARLRVAMHPSVRTLALAWAVEPAWIALRSGSASDTAGVAAHAHALLVWRKDLDAHWRSASCAEAAALARLHTAGSLEAACAGLREDEAAQAGAWFAGWVAQDMLVAGHARR